ncbi:MAG: energy transducer TonB [Muricauda sp.]|nr:M56 family metallopeptidase [Allomuricauda sp.]MAU26343.1 energy transducer TonB [Allomuricauda sp.]MBC31773.1 energy transducer TonB [Allomuricauda sp.]MBC32211.1 energy transducer TonB [Allomuricauda sp.]|tara:strand:+ start:33092 stop:34735 length:1644 start_codon:yes stop_codon:yes gene_type:complete
MVQYILETLAFQLVFLLVYDLFLKKETFFQWNRAYLLGTFVLSMVLPWIKIEALKTTVPQELVAGPMVIWQLGEVDVAVQATTERFWASIPIHYWIYGLGALFMMIWFALKLYRIYALKENGTLRYYPDFVKVTIPKSEVAFSFFKNVFLGANISPSKQVEIIAHERVHIKQWHSLDLLFFELMRIVQWFNPLVYVYQARLTELHEFIADAKVAKTDKRKHYELLLSEMFQTQSISFVNAFFKKSLIKKRIVMLAKEKSKKVYQLKYVLLLPIVLGMLVYTSCELNEPANTINGGNALMYEGKDIPFASIDEAPIFPGCENAADKKECFRDKIQNHIRKHFNYPQEAQAKGIEGRVNIIFTIAKDGQITNIRKRGPHPLLENEAVRILERLPKMQPGKHKGETVKVPFSIPITFKLSSDTDNVPGKKNGQEIQAIPFTVIDEVPIFPGCEDAADKKECFMEKIQEHIRKHFNYPKEAQEQGVQGRVNVIFTIAEDGQITNIRKRGPHPLLEAEVERIIKRLPQMQPGKHKGESVKVPFSIPVTFKLQ